MTKAEMNLKVFEGKEIPGVFFQPRIEWWYEYNRSRGTLPERYRDMKLIELFDDLDVSIRYFAYATGLPGAIGKTYSDEVKFREEVKGGKKSVIISTPMGDLVREMSRSSDGGWRTLKYPIETADDVEKAEWLFRNCTYYFIEENFERGGEFVGDRGIPQFFLPRTPYQCLSIEWMGTENLIYALADFPEKVENLMEAIDSSYDSLYEEIISCGKIKMINFGENIDGNIVPPPYFENYCVPFYEKRSRQLQGAGIYTYIHIDGSFKVLLKYLRNLPFDGIEALTPVPQGDVTLEEMREATGDKILLDGIPAIFFLPDYPLDKFKVFVEKLIDLFHPRLVLGASDEVPPPADIERVRMVSGYCRDFRWD